VLFDTWPVARRVWVVAAVAAAIAVVVAVAVVAFTGRGTTQPTASRADVYEQLVQQLKGHLAPLAPAKTTTKHVPTIHVPQQQGYSCEVASGTGCSLHPCVRYAQSVAMPPGDVAEATPVTTSRCNSTAKATPRAIPIVAP
jgi:hypothetical protein